MEIKEIQDKKVWEDFLLRCDEKTFLNSWNWGEFQKIMREKIWRFGIFENNNLFAIALVVKIVAKRGKFLLVPHGPSVALAKEGGPTVKYEILKTLLDKLKEVTKKERVDFIRVNPLWPARRSPVSKQDEGGERSAENDVIFRQMGFRTAPIQMHPEASWKLNINFSEEELLANMRKTTRYLIKQTIENKDIEVRQSRNGEDIKVFSQLHNLVSRRQYFVPFSLEYLKNEFSAFIADDQASLFFGNYKGKIAAASFVLFWSGIGFYHHAVSLPEYSKLSIPYLLQWEAIKEAKKRGCKLYDFWGYVDPEKNPLHPWAGPTLFKMGFGGKVYEYVKTQDFVLSKKYWLTYFIERLRKIKRGL